MRVAEAAKASGDVLEAARRLNVQLTEHARVLERTAQRTAKLEAALKQANDDGLLQFFNREYRRRRMAALAEGKRFPSYGAAQRRLRAAMAAIIARGGIVTASVVTTVFDGPGS